MVEEDGVYGAKKTRRKVPQGPDDIWRRMAVSVRDS